MQLLVQLSETFRKNLVCDIESCDEKISKICKVTLEIFRKIFKNGKKIEKLHIDIEKLINSFEMEESTAHLVIYGRIIFFFLNFLNNFLAVLLYKIYVFDIDSIVDFFQIFTISRSAEILILLSFWLGKYT